MAKIGADKRVLLSLEAAGELLLPVLHVVGAGAFAATDFQVCRALPGGGMSWARILLGCMSVTSEQGKHCTAGGESSLGSFRQLQAACPNCLLCICGQAWVGRMITDI